LVLSSRNTGDHEAIIIYGLEAQSIIE